MKEWWSNIFKILKKIFYSIILYTANISFKKKRINKSFFSEIQKLTDVITSRPYYRNLKRTPSSRKKIIFSRSKGLLK